MNGGFLVNLDSVAQRETFEVDEINSFKELTGVLRVGCLLTGTLYMTDAQVLDGTLLLRIGPRGVINRIGTSFEIFARAETLEQSLYKFFNNGGENLRHIEISALRNLSFEDRIELGRKITLFSTKDFDELVAQFGVVDAIANVLKFCGVSNENIEELTECWQSWIDADRKGDLTVRNRPYGQLKMTEQALRKPLKNLITNKSRLTDIELVLEQIDASATRSEIRALIESLNFSVEEKITVREWLDTVYICSIAETYDAIAVELPRSSVQRLAQRKTSDESKLLLSVESIERLSSVRIATFEIIYDKTRDDARKWRENRKGRHIKHLASTVDRDTTTDSAVRRERVKSAFRLAFVAVVLQLSSAFNLSDSYKVGLAVAAVIATDFLPVLYRNAFPKGRLTAVIDPIVK